MEPPKPESGRDPTRKEHYTLEHSAHRAYMAHRTAAVQAEFFLPYLRSGIRVLDVGCGAGSITLGIAQAVSPGEVIGVDLAAEQVQQATTGAEEQRVPNVKFLVADAYALPFVEDSFDAVFGNTLLEHLAEPARALGEFRRVLKPSGVVGVRNADFRGNLLSPANYFLLETLELSSRLRKRSGGSCEMGSEMKALLRQVGFRVVDAGASCECYTSPDGVRQFAETAASLCRHGSIATQAVELGWADLDKMERLAQAWLDWAQDPDAFEALPHVHAVGTKP